MEAMEETGPHLVLTIRSRPTDGGFAKVEVADTGTSVRKSSLATIFEPFYTTKTNGMGMGLSIARTIVDAHGGTLFGANNPAGGATFRLTLPIARVNAGHTLRIDS